MSLPMPKDPKQWGPHIRKTLAAVDSPNIAFMGKAGAGKTTAAAVLEGLGYRKLSFAAALRDTAVGIWGEEARNDRDKLQRLGVAVRDIDEDAWAGKLFRTVDQMGASSVPVCVDDMRFPNEYWGLMERGFVIVRVEADRTQRIDRLKASGKWQSEDQLAHVSESALDFEPADHFIRNDLGHDALARRVTDILNRERRRV